MIDVKIDLTFKRRGLGQRVDSYNHVRARNNPHRPPKKKINWVTKEDRDMVKSVYKKQMEEYLIKIYSKE